MPSLRVFVRTCWCRSARVSDRCRHSAGSAARVSRSRGAHRSAVGVAQETPQEPAPPAGDAARGCRGPRPRRRANPPQPRPYDQVITKEARTDDGIFKVHRIGEQLFYEIPKAELGKEFLWVTQIKRTTAGAGSAARRPAIASCAGSCAGNRVLLRLIDYSIVADPSTPIARAVADANNPADRPRLQRRRVQPAGRSGDRA